jgi:hypothetical protein
MNIPYTYLIGWSKLNKWYYGVRYAKSCLPADLWVKYFTSSNIVKQFRLLHGEPDIIEIRKTFTNAESAKRWEEKFLKRMNVIESENWLNKNDKCAPPTLFGHTHNRGRKPTQETLEKRHKSMIKTMSEKYPVENRASSKRVKANSVEYNKKLSIASKKMWETRTDKERLEIGKKISEANIGIQNRLGQKNTESHNRKISEANSGKKRTKESIEKTRLANLGKKRSEEQRKKQSEVIRLSWIKRKEKMKSSI